MLIPATRYRDPEAALAFPKDVLGLEEHIVYHSEDGKIQHTQMRVGTGMMMFGPPNVALAYTVADPEGHIWTFGDYDPLA